MNIYRQICIDVGNYSGIALIEEGLELSYPSLFGRVDAFGKLLLNAGVRPDDRVGFIAENSSDYIILSLAILSIDAIIVPFSRNASRPEIEAICADLEINFLVTSTEYSADSRILSSGCYLTRKCLYNRHIDLADNRQCAFIRFSSGTTGASKGVILSHQSVLERTSACEGLLIGEGEKVLWVLDMAFHFVVTIILFLRRRASIVLCPVPVETAMFAMIKKYKINLLYATPYHYRMMVQSSQCNRDDLSSVKFAVSTAMRLEPFEWVQFYEKFGIPLNQAYGIIEVGLPAINDSRECERCESAGKVQDSYEIKLNNPDASGTGEIWLKGPGMFDGYFLPFCLRERVCQDGWFNTGDLGRLDKDGYLYIAGRTKQIINYMGMKIFPEQVESIINQYPIIQESRVFGKKMGNLGEIPVAEVVLKPCFELNDEALTDLRRFLFARMAGYAVPKSFNVAVSIPRTASGKILR